jgi:hypothetical protein
MNFSLRSYLRFLDWMKQYWLAYRWLNILNLVLGTLGVVLSLCFVYLFKAAIDIATGVQAGNLILILVCYVVGTILERIIGFSSGWLSTLLFTKTENDMRMALFSRLMNSDWQRLQEYHSGDVQGRISKDVEYLVGMTVNTFPAIFSMLFQLTGAFVFLGILDFRLALCLLLITPLVFLLRRLYIRKQRELTHKVREQDAEVLSRYQEASQHFLVIKTHRAYSIMRKRLGTAQLEMEKRVVQKLKYSVRPFLLMRLGFDLAYLVVFVWGVIGLQNEWITYGALMAYVQLVARVQSPLKNLSQYVNAVIQGHIAFERVVALESIDRDVYSQEDITEDSSLRVLREQMLRGSIAFTLSLSNVHYKYSSNSRKILEDFSCNFPLGSVSAILGETGTGKTTLVRMLLGLITPQEGRIEWCLEGGRSYPYSLLGRDALAYVPQGNTLLSGTIRDNLLLAFPDATEEQMQSALRVAVADFVFSLPLGLDTICHEFGGGLSEGQAQRICIARALLRPCPILIFDESTSALDVATEELVIKRLISYCQKKTLIFITHRPAILEHCTQVVQLERLNKFHDHE